MTIATGEGYYPELNSLKVHWVAEKELTGLWVIKWDIASFAHEYIRHHGKLLTRQRLIRELIPCNSEVMLMYNFFDPTSEYTDD